MPSIPPACRPNRRPTPKPWGESLNRGGAYGGEPVYLVGGRRTPFLKARAARGPFSAADLAVTAGRAVLRDTGVEPAALDEVILGCVAPGVDEANIGRIVALRLGCGHRVPGWTVQRNCASGMQAIDAAAKQISLGGADLVLAGGTEAMSRAPVLLRDSLIDWLGSFRTARSVLERARLLGRLRPAWFKPVFGLLRALRDPLVDMSMGQTAEEIAHRFGIGRREMDAFATVSHLRMTEAAAQGRLAEIEPLYAPDGTCYPSDDGVRADSSVEKLAKLQPVFDRPVGKVTAGNSSQVTDGAALVLIASAGAVERLGLRPLARVVDCEWAGVDPAQMGLGPVHAIAALLARNQLQPSDVDAWEINEAFAAQVIACQRALADDAYCRRELSLGAAVGEIPDTKLNLDGGAIACGHPVGASGARIVLHLAHVLERGAGDRAVASICIGGGQGGAMLLERPLHG